MKYQHIEIRSSRQKVDEFPIGTNVSDKNVNDAFIKSIVSLPEDDVITIQISDYISDEALRKLNELFQQRPGITFRIYGGIGYPYADDGDSWNLSFLSLIPSVSELVLNCFRWRNTDFSILGQLKNLRGLWFEVFDVKDFSFLSGLSENLEILHIDAEVFSGKPKFDCQCLLRFQSLHTLYLGHVEKNLSSIVGLRELKKLTFRGVATKDLSFLKNLNLQELEISWCSASRVDWNSLWDLFSLKSLTLFSIKKLEDISFISSLSNLERLKFVWMGAVTRLPDLSNLTKLRVIDFETCNKLVDVSGLANVRSLETVRIFGKNLTKEAAEVLAGNPSIKELVCNGYQYDPTSKSWICLYK